MPKAIILSCIGVLVIRLVIPPSTEVTNTSQNTIASLLYHMSFYNDVVMQRLAGVNPAISSANGFDIPPIKNEHDWKKLKERNLDSARKLAEAVKNCC